MSFLLRCPQCGDRSVYEFRFCGEVKQRPAPDASEEEWENYTYTKANELGVQKEWWFHRSGCREWIQALRNTANNQVIETAFPDEGS